MAVPAFAYADPLSAPGIPDLLHPVPIRRVDVDGVSLGMALAFASGVSGGLFNEALDHARVAPTDWQPAAFSVDLFLPHFVAQCFRPRVAGEDAAVSMTQLVRLLAQPPADPAIVVHRRAISAELLARPEMRRNLERLYVLVCRFRTLLEGATGRGYDTNRRQLDVLQSAKEIFDCMAEDFADSRSGLGRLAEYGRRVREGEPFRSLCDLLRYDENVATLDLKVGVGADGHIRGFRIVSIVENAANPFVTSPLRRWLAKGELFLRGFHFGDHELMARLIDAVFEGLKDELVSFVQLVGDLEFYLGALGFHDTVRAAGLSVCLPELVPPGAPRKLEGFFNPLLLHVGPRVVPCNVDLDHHDVTTLITGPNSGGKTRLLQAVGLAQVLAQSGLFVPARSATMSLVSSLVVSLIQESRADQAEGRLGMELLRIRNLFERLPPGAMVILDELCSGTNPSEGEEIFELVASVLTRLEPQAFITTHFLAFSARLEREKKIPGLRFLQVELGKNQEPTYQFVPGVATTSLAGHAAARLGVTAEQLSALVEQNLSLAAAVRPRA